jgi:hypothetical protein
MTKAFVSGGITAVVCGLFGATSFALFYGTAALPFIISASAGFTIGALGFYRDTVSKALIAMERYPLLLRMHLQANFPGQRFDLWDVRRFRAEEFQRSWVLSNMLAASWLSATPALEVSLRHHAGIDRSALPREIGSQVMQRILQQEEDAIVALEIEKDSWKK